MRYQKSVIFKVTSSLCLLISCSWFNASPLVTRVLYSRAGLGTSSKFSVETDDVIGDSEHLRNRQNPPPPPAITELLSASERCLRDGTEVSKGEGLAHPAQPAISLQTPRIKRPGQIQAAREEPLIAFGAAS